MTLKHSPEMPHFLRYTSKLFPLGLLGLLFVDNKEPAFAGLKMIQSLGAAVAFGTSQVMCTWIRLVVVTVLLVLAMLGYSALEAMIWWQRTKDRSTRKGPTTV